MFCGIFGTGDQTVIAFTQEPSVATNSIVQGYVAAKEDWDCTCSMQRSALIISNTRIVTVYEGFCISCRASSIALVTSVVHVNGQMCPDFPQLSSVITLL